MVKLYAFFAVFACTLFTVHSQSYYRLEQVSNSSARSYCGFFAINGLGYIFGGQDVSSAGDTHAKLGDLLQYNPKTDTWMPKASVPAANSRNMPFAFASGALGYIGGGSHGTTRLDDVWKYSPQDDVWMQLGDYGDGNTFGAISFVIDGVPYVGTGSHGGAVSDKLFKYDVTNDQWAEQASVPGGGRWYAASCSIGGKGYVMFGSVAGNGATKDVYEYDPIANAWGIIESFPGETVPGSSNLRVFTLNNKAYAIINNTNAAHSGLEIWEFFPEANGDSDPATEVWTQISLNKDIEDRFGFYGFVLDNQLYFGGGQSSVFHDDFYRFMAYDSVKVTTTICESDPLFLQGEWRTTAGTYVDSLINRDGFDSIVVTEVTEVYPVFDVSVTFDGNTFTANNSTADAYQWFNATSGVDVPGAESQQFVPTDAGEYAVRITKGVCTSESVANLFKLSQGITFSPLSAVVVGDADFELTATSDAGLSISYASSNLSVATVSGSTVHIVGVGNTTITASQGGNTSYHAATSVERQLVVQAATSLSNRVSEEVTFYPNPASKMIYFNQKDLVVELYSLLGTKVMQKHVFDGCLDISSLSSGSYVVLVGTQMQKLLID